MSTGYSQRDALWAAIRLGPGPDSIGADGCYLTTDAMVATWMGRVLNPEQLNGIYLQKGTYGAGCGECLPDNALARAFPDLVQQGPVYDYSQQPADLSKLDNSDPQTFKCVELGWLANGEWLTHFAPVYDGTKGASSTMLDPWPVPAYVRPIADYGAPATLIQKIVTWHWLKPAPAPTPAPAPADPSGYWPGWDIAKRAVMLDATTGFKLDGWGGLHPIGGIAAPQISGYWKGWDIARAVALNPDRQGGYVLDGWGGLHPWAIAGATLPPTPPLGAYWPGWDIARDLVLTGQGKGFVLDGWGGLHAFG